jgi:RNase P subunit RPR2
MKNFSIERSIRGVTCDNCGRLIPPKKYYAKLSHRLPYYEVLCQVCLDIYSKRLQKANKEREKEND